MTPPNPYQSSVVRAQDATAPPRSAALLCGSLAWLGVLWPILPWFGAADVSWRMEGTWLGLLSLCLAFIGTLLGLINCFQIGESKRQGIVGLGLSAVCLLAWLVGVGV